MLTDEQLLQSQAVRDVIARMGNQGLHKTAGAVALGVDEVTLENAVLAICTKIAAQVLKEQRIASGLASLAKTASTLAGFSPVLAGTLGGIHGTPEGADPSHGAMLGASGALVAPVGAVAGGLVGSLAGSRGQNAGALIGANLAAFTAGRGASSVHGLTSDAVQAAEEAAFARRRAAAAEAEKTAANPFTAVANRPRGSAKTVPHAAPPRPPADVIAPVGGGAMRLTGAGDAPVPNKVLLPEWMRGQQAAELPTMRSGVERMSAPSGAPKAKSKATVEGADAGELPSMFRLDSSAGQTTLAPSARKGGAGIMRDGGVAAAQPMNFGSGQVGDQAAPMFNLQEMMSRGGKTAAILDRIFAA